jgi:hypothetical protein
MGMQGREQSRPAAAQNQYIRRDGFDRRLWHSCELIVGRHRAMMAD